MLTSQQSLLADFLADINNPSLMWQIGLVTLGLVAAWLVNHLIKKRLSSAPSSWKFGIGGITRVAFPLTALIVVLIGKAVASHLFNVHVLNLAIPLLISLAIIRLAVYMLRHIFAPSGWVQTSERFIVIVVWVGLALHITGYLPEIFKLLDDLGFNIGKQRISLLLVMQGLISVAFTLLAAMWLGRILETPIMAAEKLDMNLRVVLSKLISAVLLIIAIMIALPAVGIDLTVLSVLGGALGVGLGFGLQKIASNYVSGFIILLDKSIHLGDTLTVDNRYGTVSRLTARYMVLKGQDGTESIIPNETLIISTVVNHSYSDRKIRVNLVIQISYSSSLETAMHIMLEAAKAHSRVIADPEPKVYLKEFSDNGINLEMAVWISDPEEGQLSLRSDINLVIWREFQEQGIEIPFPQRDIRIVSQPSVVPHNAG